MTVEEYITAAPEPQREVLQALRRTVLETAPDAVESISYGMPGYKWKGRPLFHFALQKKHIGLHPGSEAVDAFASRLTDYKCTKGGIQIPLGRDMPHALIAEIIRHNMARKGESL